MSKFNPVDAVTRERSRLYSAKSPAERAAWVYIHLYPVAPCVPQDARATLPALIALARMGASLRKRYGAHCSYEWADTPRYRAATEALENRIRQLALHAGIRLSMQGDPRGAVLRVLRPGECASASVGLFLA